MFSLFFRPSQCSCRLCGTNRFPNKLIHGFQKYFSHSPTTPPIEWNIVFGDVFIPKYTLTKISNTNMFFRKDVRIKPLTLTQLQPLRPLGSKGSGDFGPVMGCCHLFYHNHCREEKGWYRGDATWICVFWSHRNLTKKFGTNNFYMSKRFGMIVNPQGRLDTTHPCHKICDHLNWPVLTLDSSICLRQRHQRNRFAELFGSILECDVCFISVRGGWVVLPDHWTSTIWRLGHLGNLRAPFIQ